MVCFEARVFIDGAHVAYVALSSNPNGSTDQNSSSRLMDPQGYFPHLLGTGHSATAKGVTLACAQEICGRKQTPSPRSEVTADEIVQKQTETAHANHSSGRRSTRNSYTKRTGVPLRPLAVSKSPLPRVLFIEAPRDHSSEPEILSTFPSSMRHKVRTALTFCTNFSHVTRADILENCGIAWPSRSIWLPPVANAYRMTSPLKHNQLVVNEDLHTHSPRRRGNSINNSNHGSCDPTDFANGAAISGRQMAPLPHPALSSVPRNHAWEATPVGTMPDPFTEGGGHGRRRQHRSTEDSDISMPDYSGNAQPHVPTYQESTDPYKGAIPRQSRLPAVSPSVDPYYDEMLHISASSNHRVNPISAAFPSPGLAPPANTRNNSAANSPPVASTVMAAVAANQPNGGMNTARDDQLHLLAYVGQLGGPRGVTRVAEIIDVESPAKSRSASVMGHQFPDELSGRKDRVRDQGKASSNSPTLVGDCSNAARPTSSSGTTIRCSSNTPKENAAPASSTKRARGSPPNRRASEGKRKRASAASGEGQKTEALTSPRKRVMAMVESIEEERGDAKVATEGIARTRGRRGQVEPDDDGTS